MENKTPVFSKILFSLTVAFLVTASVIFIVSAFAVGNVGESLNPNAFSSYIYWILVLAGTGWYIYKFGFPRSKQSGEGEQTYITLLSISVPLLVGMGLALVAYYVFYGLAILFLAALGYIITLAIVVGMIFAVRFLIDLYFKSHASTPRQTWAMMLSLIASIALLLLALYTKVLFR